MPVSEDGERRQASVLKRQLRSLKIPGPITGES